MLNLNFLSLRILLVLICVVFLLTRLYKITEIPSSLYWDEASIGYNAYSVSLTGRDEWGDFLPIHFRAFGEFKLPVYIYATVVAIKLFGFSEFSVRLPAVLFSLGVVILIYLLGRKLSGKESIGLLSSFFLSISPWFFIFSRSGYEATAGVFFYLLAIYLFILTTNNKGFLLLSAISFVLSIYSYNSFRIITPLTIIILLFSQVSKVLITSPRTLTLLLLSLIFFLLSLIPIYRLYTYDAGSLRLHAISDISLRSFGNYLTHFSPDFLFVKGDSNLRSQQEGFGQLHLTDALLLPLGVFYLFRSNIHYKLVFVLLVLVGPIPAAITKESPHALRAISTLPFLCILSALGVSQVKSFISKKGLLDFGILFISSVLFLNYFLNLITVYPAMSSKDWQFGYKRLFKDYQSQFAKYDRIVISDEYGQPYIFALFYSKIDPDRFRSSVVRSDVSNWGFSTVSKFDNLEFGKINKALKNGNLQNTLVFASRNETVTDKNPVSSIRFLDNSIAFWVYSYD